MAFNQLILEFFRAHPEIDFVKPSGRGGLDYLLCKYFNLDAKPSSVRSSLNRLTKCGYFKKIKIWEAADGFNGGRSGYKTAYKWIGETKGKTDGSMD